MLLVLHFPICKMRIIILTMHGCENIMKSSLREQQVARLCSENVLAGLRIRTQALQLEDSGQGWQEMRPAWRSYYLELSEHDKDFSLCSEWDGIHLWKVWSRKVMWPGMSYKVSIWLTREKEYRREGEEDIAIIPARGSHGLDQSTTVGLFRGGWIPEIFWSRSSEDVIIRMNVRYKRERIVKDYCKIFGLSN